MVAKGNASVVAAPLEANMVVWKIEASVVVEDGAPAGRYVNIMVCG